MRGVFYGRETKAKMEGDARKELHSRAVAEADGAAAGGSAHHRANADHLRDQSQAQQMLRREQDLALGSLSGSLSRVNEMAVTISSELKEQDKILEDVDSAMDTAQGKMDSAIKSIEVRGAARRLLPFYLRLPPLPPQLHSRCSAPVHPLPLAPLRPPSQPQTLLKTKDKCQLMTICTLVIVFMIVAIIA
jgi:hypothetical protein